MFHHQFTFKNLFRDTIRFFFFFFKFKGNAWGFSNMQGIKPSGAVASGIRSQLYILGLATFPALLTIPRPADGAGQRMTGFLLACSRACTHSIFGHPCSKFERWPGRGPKTLSPPGQHSITTGSGAELGRSAGLGALLRAGTRLWGGLPGKGRVPEAFVSTTPAAAPPARAALPPRRPRAPRERAPKPGKENGPGSKFHKPLVSPHYPTDNRGSTEPHPPPAPQSPRS